MRMRHRDWTLLLAMAACTLLIGCRPDHGADESTASNDAGGATRPAEAVRMLTRDLRGNRLDRFAHDAVPPDLRAQLDSAWRAGRTRWPLDELPFGKRLPGILQALGAPNAETHWQQVFDHQFAHADGEIHSTAATLGLFGMQYVRNEESFSESERDHYAQLVAAASRWAQTAPLSDPGHARTTIPTLVAIARGARLNTTQDFARLGMQDSLQRLTPVSAGFKAALRGYGLDVDGGLDALDASLQSQTGDTAKVRMRYPFAGQPIDTIIDVERHGGRWYVSDFLRHARAAAGSSTSAATQAPAAGPARPAGG